MNSLHRRGYSQTKAAVDEPDEVRAGYVPAVPLLQGGRVFRRLYSEDQERGGQGRKADGPTAPWDHQKGEKTPRIRAIITINSVE